MEAKLQSIAEILDKEESQDIQFRSKNSGYDISKTILPSTVLQKDLREGLAKFKSVFDLARDTSDKAIIQSILGPDYQEVGDLHK